MRKGDSNMRKIPMGEMAYQEKNGVGWLTFPSWDALPGVRHAFSTRIGGVSEGPFASMNLNFGRGDPREHVEENFRRFCDAAGFSFDTLAASAQDHHTEIRRMTAADCGVGITRPKDRESVDGLVTNEPGVTLVTYYADCTPLFFFDPVHRAIGLGHAGWRGTAAGMALCMAERMQQEFGTDPRELFAAIGPAIGPCCYEVDEAVRSVFCAGPLPQAASYFTAASNGRYQLDLWRANKGALLAAGLLPEHITTAHLCTRCNHRLLWSHRATGGVRGGLAAFLTLVPEGEG